MSEADSSARASPTRTCTRSRAGWSGCGATCPSTTRARSTSRRSVRTPTPTPSASGSSGAAGRWRPSPAAVPSRPTSTPSCPTGRSSCPTATTTAPGSTAARSRSPGSTPALPTRRTAGSSATPRAARAARSTRVRRRWSPGYLPRTSGEDYYAGLMEGQRYLHSVGVTSWQDAIVGAYSGMDDPGSTYVKAAANGDLRSHVVGALWWERRLGVEQVDDLVGRREALSGGRFQARAVKVMQDGVAENFTAAMLTPYLDAVGSETSNRGHSFVEAGALREAVTALDAAGFQVHVHAIGDRASREALDAFEGSAPRASAPHRAHPGRAPRRRTTLRRARCRRQRPGTLGLRGRADDRADAAVPRAGAVVVAVPLRRPAPRRRPSRDGQRLAGQHARPARRPCMSRSTARRTARTPNRSCPARRSTSRRRYAAYTSGSAWINRRDELDGAGELAPGAAADLVVLDRDPFAGPPDEIGATSVVSTWIDGEVVSSLTNRR